ncbi:hypothetical protein EUGRSUZ_G03406 [Eucalyptus grandis]|uniref:Uncharacterized protein n=2 Tax=Eucalyptus grandis TaxID=71139 RepID=A0ACC3KAQ4_EUCGR|nr:hypothetical protein EUGRSUZ_G03406 [Eucalyptus grandis]
MEEEGVNLEWSLPVPSAQELLVNHKTSDEGMRMMKENVRGSFELPYHEKQKSAERPGSLEGYRQAFITSQDQKLERNGMIFLKCLPAFSCKKSRSQRLRKAAVAVVKYIGMALVVHEGELQLMKSFREGSYEVRMNYYPPCPESERVMGLSTHADNSGITMLMECGNLPGLQVLSGDGRWVTFPPVPSSTVVNLGQIREVYSNGTYRAPDHRAVVNKEKERVSIVTCYPSPSLPVGSSPQLLAATGLTPLYQTLSHSEYLQSFYNRKLNDAVPIIKTLKL